MILDYWYSKIPFRTVPLNYVVVGSTAMNNAGDLSTSTAVEKESVNG